MPSLHQLWKSLHSQIESQSRLRTLLVTSVRSLSSKPKPSAPVGRDSSHSHSSPQSTSASSPNFEFEFSRSFGTTSEVADAQPLSASEALSRVFATPSVHGPVWQNFGHQQYQAGHVVQPVQALEWKISSANSRLWLGKHVKVDKKFEELHRTRHRTIQQLELCEVPRLNPICEFVRDDTDDNQDTCLDEKGGDDIALQIQSIVSTSLAFHILRTGPCVPAVNALLREAIQATSSGVASVPQLSLMLDSTPEDDNIEVKDKEKDGRRTNTKGLRLLSGACCLPHPEKTETGGEDAYFICSDKEVIGVADGVGGWADMGIDAGEYARQLMHQSLIAARQEPRGCINAARVLEIAHSKTCCEGSSTACILALSDQGLQAANLGDSGFLVVRNGRVIFKSPAQQHNFNFPFQLESDGGDPPTAAQVFTVDVIVGDVVVAGTDGLFDNLFDTELTSMVVQAARSGFSPDITAQKIASLARERAQDRNRQTPFSTAAQDAGFRFYGGKLDDITVIVSFVTSDIMS